MVIKQFKYKQTNLNSLSCRHLFRDVVLEVVFLDVVVVCGMCCLWYVLFVPGVVCDIFVCGRCCLW